MLRASACAQGALFLSSVLQPFVDRLAARSKLSLVEQQAILDLPTAPLHLSANKDVSRVDTQLTYSCFVASGLLARFDQSRGGRRQLTALFIPGDMPDLHSLVRPVGIGGLTALNESLIFRVPHTALWELVQAHPAIALAFWRECVADAAIAQQWMLNLGQRGSRARLAHLFCELAIRHGANSGNVRSFNFRMTQVHLADAVGMTPIHVNRMLKTLREKGLASLAGGVLTIMDWEGLAHLGDFDPVYCW